jgi:hypothetical protein
MILLLLLLQPFLMSRLSSVYTERVPCILFLSVSAFFQGGLLIGLRLSILFLFQPGYLSRIALRYGLDDREFESRQGLGIFLFTTASRPALWPTQPPIQWVPGALSPRVKRPGREADQSPPSSAKFKNAWSYTSTLSIRLHGMVLS